MRTFGHFSYFFSRSPHLDLETVRGCIRGLDLFPGSVSATCSRARALMLLSRYSGRGGRFHAASPTKDRRENSQVSSQMALGQTSSKLVRVAVRGWISVICVIQASEQQNPCHRMRYSAPAS